MSAKALDASLKGHPGGLTCPLKILDRLMVTRLVVTAAELKTRRWPYKLEESIPKEPRLMLIANGSADYRVDDFQCRLRSGQILYMPAWVSREWKVSKSPGRTELAWCRFSSIESEFGEVTQPFVHTVGDLALELASFQRIADRITLGGTAAVLEAEGELKAILGRLFARLEPSNLPSRERPSSGGEQGVERAIEFLKSHFTDPKALSQVPKVSGLHPKYFRSLFRKYTGVTPSNYLLQLRMRAARYHQHESNMRVKEVAAAVGYDDAFYFSRLYRRFWGHAPTDDRRPLNTD